MSLRDVVMEIADEMEAEVGEGIKSVEMGSTVLLYFANQFRRAVKASEGEVQLSPGKLATRVKVPKELVQIHPQDIGNIDEEMFLITQATEGMKKLKEGTRTEERLGSRMVEIVGGPGDFTMVEIPNDMPVGAKTHLFGVIYQLQDDHKIHYNEEETNMMLENRRR